MPRRISVPSSTARATAKSATAEFDPALMRLAVNGLCSQQAALGRPMRRSEARRIITEQVRRGELPAPLRNAVGVVDPTGETAARNVDRRREQVAR